MEGSGGFEKRSELTALPQGMPVVETFSPNEAVSVDLSSRYVSPNHFLSDWPSRLIVDGHVPIEQTRLLIREMGQVGSGSTELIEQPRRAYLGHLR